MSQPDKTSWIRPNENAWIPCSPRVFKKIVESFAMPDEKNTVIRKCGRESAGPWLVRALMTKETRLSSERVWLMALER